MAFCITLPGCRAELAELTAKGSRLNAGNSYESFIVIYWLRWREDRGHGVVFTAWIRVLWWNEGALCWLNYKKCAPGPHKDPTFSLYSLTDNINDVHHNFCIIWKFNTCNCELLFFLEIANTAKLQAWCYWWVIVGLLYLYYNGQTERTMTPHFTIIICFLLSCLHSWMAQKEPGSSSRGGGVELIAFNRDEFSMISAI